jgi:3-phosphoshikimate 1-carboxyvinyltransferase
MALKLSTSILHSSSKITITGSKSESNRMLVLQALFDSFIIENLSNSDDTQVLQKALASKEEIINIHHAGTAMRFLTAYLAIQENKTRVLTGSSRMKERPIGVLVDALKSLGADISYKEKEGFPPLLIKGKELIKNRVELKANVSSQYISALLLIAPILKNGLQLTLIGEVTSVPYINMTLSLLNDLGVETKFINNVINVKPFKNNIDSLVSKTFVVESDWSSASYFYSIIALSDIGTTIELSSYKENSLQGDAVLAAIYNEFGVNTKFNTNTIQLTKVAIGSGDKSFNLKNSPDIAQTIVVTAFAMGLSCDLQGLHTLRIKETDRLEALKIELRKFGADIIVTENSLHLKRTLEIKLDVCVDTYQDHRMAMAFAPLALKTNLVINNSEVVSKSYPEFWNDLKTVGIQINKI